MFSTGVLINFGSNTDAYLGASVVFETHINPTLGEAIRLSSCGNAFTIVLPCRITLLACSPLTTPSLARLALAFRDAYQSRQFGHGCVRLRISAACDNLWSAVLCWQQRTATASLALAITKAEGCSPWWNKFREGQVPNAA